MIRIGCAGWPLPRDADDRFPEEGTHLERYAAVFPATEINSTFHRPHRAATFARWAASVPEDFRFSVKLPKTITHVAKLVDSGGLLDEFMGPVSALGDKLGCLLVQLPPKLVFEADRVDGFFSALRARHRGAVVVEPRHSSWFESDARELLVSHEVGRVGADPPRATGGDQTGGWTGIAYYRLHGSPRMYYDAYGDDFLAALAGRLAGLAGSLFEPWCIFDNTAAQAAVPNALRLMHFLEVIRDEKEPR